MHGHKSSEMALLVQLSDFHSTDENLRESCVQNSYIPRTHSLRLVQGMKLFTSISLGDPDY